VDCNVVYSSMYYLDFLHNNTMQGQGLYNLEFMIALVLLNEVNKIHASKCFDSVK